MGNITCISLFKIMNPQDFLQLSNEIILFLLSKQSHASIPLLNLHYSAETANHLCHHFFPFKSNIYDYFKSCKKLCNENRNPFSSVHGCIRGKALQSQDPNYTLYCSPPVHSVSILLQQSVSCCFITILMPNVQKPHKGKW